VIYLFFVAQIDSTVATIKTVAVPI